MSADLPFFKNQLEDCKKTWLSLLETPTYNKFISQYVDIVDWKYYDSCFNKKCHLVQTQDGKNTIELNPDCVIQDENDSHHLINVLFDDKWTFQKTYGVLKYVTEHIYYDYIIRTNTSTYINIPLISYILYKEFNDKRVDNNIAYGTDLMSVHSTNCPNPGDIYIRGNCLILSRHQVKNVILKYGQLFSTGITSDIRSNLIDDVCIGNILNCYYNHFVNQQKYNNDKIMRNFSYLKNICALPKMWFKCTDKINDFCHTWCRDGYGQDFNTEDNEIIRLFAHAAAIQIRSYYTEEGREKTEHAHYIELHKKMEDNVYMWYVDENILLNIYNRIKEYTKNPDVFVQGNLPYIDLKTLIGLMSHQNEFNKLTSWYMHVTPIDHQLWPYKLKLMQENNVDFNLNKIDNK